MTRRKFPCFFMAAARGCVIRVLRVLRVLRGMYFHGRGGVYHN